jgi:hypothetical protein
MFLPPLRRTQRAISRKLRTPALTILSEGLVLPGMQLRAEGANFSEIYSISLDVIRARSPRMSCILRVRNGIFNRFGSHDWKWQDRYSSRTWGPAILPYGSIVPGLLRIRYSCISVRMRPDWFDVPKFIGRRHYWSRMDMCSGTKLGRRGRAILGEIIL